MTSTSTSTHDKTYEFHSAYEETSFMGNDKEPLIMDDRLSTMEAAEDMTREKYPEFKPNSEFTFELNEAGLVVFRLNQGCR